MIVFTRLAWSCLGIAMAACAPVTCRSCPGREKSFEVLFPAFSFVVKHTMRSLKWCLGRMASPLLVIAALHAVPSHAQSSTANKRVGILSGFGCEGSLVDFGRRLAELGWVEGKNLITHC